MGVAGLWPVHPFHQLPLHISDFASQFLEQHAQKTTLLEVAVSDGFNSNPGGQRALRLGIDASIWLRQALASPYAVYHGGDTMISLYRQCGRLFRLPIIPFFVFDGPHRASNKRGKAVKYKLLPNEQNFRQLLECFGFGWQVVRIAPGEAEAQLAALSQLGIIDAVLSTDVDTLVFGADRILRVTGVDKNSDSIQISSYSASALAENNFTRPNLIFIALLSGGDYAVRDGITGCGIKTAVELTRTDLGPRLIHSLQVLPIEEWPNFFVQWRVDLTTILRDNPGGTLTRQHPGLAAAVPADFPDPAILALYLTPDTSPLDPLVCLNWKPPFIPSLARFAEVHFSWASQAGILNDFDKHIFVGLALREVIRDVLVNDGEVAESAMAPYSFVITPVRTKYCKRSQCEARITLEISTDLIKAVGSKLVGQRTTRQSKEELTKDWEE
ncbi:PIN domain-like protein [Hymenopellis radicata]|nr:PIN domain-like protein [Hymenopellis radicata]